MERETQVNDDQGMDVGIGKQHRTLSQLKPFDYNGKLVYSW